MKTTDLIQYLDNYLNIQAISDYGPQGLQVEADNDNIERIALAVDVAPPIIQAAAQWQADMLLVHHGIFWRTVERIAGPLGARVRLLLQNNMHLYAAHLALDAHPEVGNNAQLAHMLGLKDVSWWCQINGVDIGVIGTLDMPLTQLTEEVETRLNTQARVLAHGPAHVQRLAIVSGFGADQVLEAKKMGADTLLTGEMSHAHYWAASDYGVNVLFGGHYATETVGVRALGQHLTEKFGVSVRFFDFPTAM
ncbi:MAG: Nif3-like dinuclear metal center hexameric protein [Candidatus Thermofonsia bacterium]|nr:MAG: Nif3-like dinuclear metal center hexameric protein [Candidatus Thermofonsia bacterium]